MGLSEISYEADMTSSTLNTASNLRWRARVTKEAVLDDDDDSYFYSPTKQTAQEPSQPNPAATPGDRWEMVEQPSATSHRFWSTFLLDSIAATAVACSVYAQTQILNVSLTVTTLQWFWWLVSSLACTFTCAVSLLTVWQYRKLRTLGSLRHVHNQTRRTVRSLQQQNERVRRTLTVLDRTQDQLRQVEGELQQYTNTQDVQRLVKVLHEYKSVQQRLQTLVQHQVQEQILRAVLETDYNHDYTLQAPELERLLHRLKAIKGVDVAEDQLRALLVQDNASSVSLTSILQLLRKAGEDGAKTMDSTGFDEEETVFRFCPRQLVTKEVLIQL
jgi:hypothetical protein